MCGGPGILNKSNHSLLFIDRLLVVLQRTTLLSVLLMVCPRESLIIAKYCVKVWQGGVSDNFVSC